jgi:hypothetical protein
LISSVAETVTTAAAFLSTFTTSHKPISGIEQPTAIPKMKSFSYSEERQSGADFAKADTTLKSKSLWSIGPQ